MPLELIGNVIEVKGDSALNPFPSTVYFTDIYVGELSITASAIDPGVDGTLDIGTTTAPAAGINGNHITITGQEGGPAANPLGSGTGGSSILKGGKGGTGDSTLVGGTGGDAIIEGGIAGDATPPGGPGTPGNVQIGVNDTTSIIVGANVLADVDGGFNIGASGANRPDYIYAKTDVVVGNSVHVKSDRITLNATSGDVGTPAAGDFWYNATSGKLKYRHGSTTYELADTSSGGIPNPGTKANNDLLQYKSGTTTWDAVGGAVGDPILGTLYTSALTIVGTGNASPLLWNTDNANDIGASGATRPRTIYAGTSVVVNGFNAITTDNVGAVGLNSVKEITVGTGDTTMASYTWAANELLVTSAIEWIIVAGSDSNSQTFSFRIEYYDGGAWNGLTTNVTFATSNGAMIVYRVLLMMSPVSNTRVFVWGHGCSGTIDTRADNNLGSSTFLTTANRGLRLIMRKISGSYTGIASSIMRELRGG